MRGSGCGCSLDGGGVRGRCVVDSRSARCGSFGAGRWRSLAFGCGRFSRRCSRKRQVRSLAVDIKQQCGAILGLAERQNLFVDQTGEWNKGCYLPAFVRRYPFCISKLYVDGQARKERLVCIIKAYLDDRGLALFDESDRPTTQWQAIERLLQGYEDDLDATAEFCAILTRLELLSPFKFEVMNDQKATLTVQGMHRVDEAKLKDIKPANLKVLVTKGLMGHI